MLWCLAAPVAQIKAFAMLLRPGDAALLLKPSLTIDCLTLSSFRNYDSARIEPSAGLIALCGHNRAGTNQRQYL